MKREVRWKAGNHAQGVCDESKGGKHRFLSRVLTYWRVQGEVDRLR